MGVLRIQSMGVEVRQLQQILNKLVVVPPLLSVDGIFGPKTEARVVMFQTQTRLVPDGIVGPKTNGALVASVLVAALYGGSASRRA
jgi:peptidoglycan hydrolase-like protein with peptidoglycan-binding domain